MFPALNLPDMDALDPAALKAMILAQHDQYRDRFQAQHERYTATLTSRASEIERLVLLVEKLQRMLFGAKSCNGCSSERRAKRFSTRSNSLSSSWKTYRRPVP